MHATKRCMQQRDASTKEMHATKRCKHQADACNKEMQAPWRYMQQRDANSKDAGTKRCNHQRDARSKICVRRRDACVQKMPASTPMCASKRCPRRRKSKKMPASTQVQEDARVDACPRRCPRCKFKRYARRPSLACVQEMPASAKLHAHRPPCVRPRDAHVGHVMPALATSYPSRPSPASAKDGRVYFDACKDARVACYLSAKDARIRGGYRAATWSCRLHLSSHVLPHDEEQREEGVWL